jgi:membrane protease subunit HflK
MNDEEHSSLVRGSIRHTAGFGLWIALGLMLVYLGSGIYSVAPHEVGVVLRCGRIAEAAVPPGIHYALPWPVDRVARVPVRNVMRLSVDDFHEGSDIARTFRAMSGLESYLLSGDNNVVTVSCVLQYSIADPASYLFTLADSEGALRSLACNTLIHAMARLTVSDILTVGKASIQLYVQQELQRQLDELESGLVITFVELQDVRPPNQVQANFNDVINSKIDRDKAINNAISYRNERLPQAKAEADRLLREAEAYRERVVVRAEGDSDRFLKQLAAYQRAPSITRRRLYLELLAEIMPTVRKSCIVGEQDGHPLARVVAPRTPAAGSKP